MKSKAPLAMMEQMVMVLVFALAAAVVLRGFVLADSVSKRSSDLDHAVIAAQTAAEQVKAAGGDWKLIAGWLNTTVRDGGMILYYDENWQRTEQESSRKLILQTDPDTEAGLGRCEICVYRGEEPIFRIPLCWQEAFEE